MHHKKMSSKINYTNKLSTIELKKISGGSEIPESIQDSQPIGTSVYDICIYEHSKHGLPIRGEPIFGPDDRHLSGEIIPMKGGCDGLPNVNDKPKE